MNECNKYENVIIDDARLKNEFDHLSKNGFIIIKLVISKQLQYKRLLETYPNDYLNHVMNTNNVTEKMIGAKPCITINVDNEEHAIHQIEEFVSSRLLEQSR